MKWLSYSFNIDKKLSPGSKQGKKRNKANDN